MRSHFNLQTLSISLTTLVNARGDKLLVWVSIFAFIANIQMFISLSMTDCPTND